MDRRQVGFSLAEIGLATAIVVTCASAVAVAGNAVMTQAKEQEMIERIKDLYQAGEKSIAVQMESGSTDRYTGYVDSSPYMAFRSTGNPSFDWYVKNPYTLTEDFVIIDWCSTDGGYCDTYPNTAYGAPLVPIKGRMIFFVADNAAKSFKVWNGVTDVYFRSYAYQAINQNGNPLVTLGR